MRTQTGKSQVVTHLDRSPKQHQCFESQPSPQALVLHVLLQFAIQLNKLHLVQYSLLQILAFPDTNILAYLQYTTLTLHVYHLHLLLLYQSPITRRSIIILFIYIYYIINSIIYYIFYSYSFFILVLSTNLSKLLLNYFSLIKYFKPNDEFIYRSNKYQNKYSFKSFCIIRELNTIL